MFNRRDFVKGATASAVGIAAIGMLDGCGNPTETEGNKSSTASQYASKVKETIDADVLVVGSGVSGLAAAVQAAELGLKTALIEVNSSRGGIGPEGISAMGSTLQKKLGIDIAMGDVIEHDDVFFNFRLNALFWQDMLKASGENIDWLISKGVEFTGVVDDYKGSGKFKMFHWFPGDHNCANAYSAHMEKAFTSSNNASLILKTRGRELIMDGDKVVGLYATKSDDSVVRFNAKAIVLGTGGYGGNYDMVAERWNGLYKGRWECDGILSNAGDGLNMALAVGGNDVSRERCFLGKIVCKTKDTTLFNFGNLTRACWVNETGERFTNEACNTFGSFCTINPVINQQKSYAIMDANILSDKDVISVFPDALNKAKANADAENLIMADSLEQLADKLGFDKKLFISQIQKYNTMCDAGKDSLFKKEAKNLIKIGTAPFFAARQILRGHSNIGDLEINRNMQVIRRDYSAIKGLYAVGIESNMNYRETYTIEIPGSAMCFNVYSGRAAVKHIAANR